jgi:hypothetical protein
VTAIRRLATEDFRHFSDGWGDAVATTFLACGFEALNFFALFLETYDTRSAAGLVGFAVIPLIVSWDVASTSSECVHLHDCLNNKRVSAPTDANDHLAIQKLETMVERVNSKQGIGFLLGTRHMRTGVLLNTSTLIGIGRIVAALAATGLPVLLAWRPGMAKADC